MTLSSLILLATQAARTIAAIRSVVAREHPDSLEAFDAAIANARRPWQDAADAAEGGAE